MDTAESSDLCLRQGYQVSMQMQSMSNLDRQMEQRTRGFLDNRFHDTQWKNTTEGGSPQHHKIEKSTTTRENRVYFVSFRREEAKGRSNF